jgi:hypothetical protein
MDNFILDEIISIKRVGTQDTIDIAVSGDNLFVANGILTHNCAYGQANPGMEGVAESLGIVMTADMIATIFQTEEDRELGIIRLGMPKNRLGPRGMVQTMKIDYSTLTVHQSDEEEEMMSGDDEISLLEKLSN